jgi:D-aspartate ligase
VLIAENPGLLRRWFLLPDQPPGLPRTVASKKGLFRLCKDLGVPCPEASFPTSWGEVEEFAAGASFPVVVKGIERWRLPPGTGVRSTTIVQTREQLLDLCRRLDGSSHENLMLQEYIPRDRAQDWIFHGYCDVASECLVSFTGVKVRSYPAHAGPTSLGRSVDNDALRQQTEKLMSAISYRGIMDLDYRLDLRDGKYKLLDFNPRVGAQFRLFEDEAGIDVVRALHLDLTGREVPRRRQAEGRVFFVESGDLLAGLAYRRNRELTLRAWLSSLQGAHREAAWFARDDLAPFALMSVHLLLRAVQRAHRRTSRMSRALLWRGRKGDDLQRIRQG